MTLRNSCCTRTVCQYESTHINLRNAAKDIRSRLIKYYLEVDDEGEKANKLWDECINGSLAAVMLFALMPFPLPARHPLPAPMVG
jgi:hypothetical protein